MGLHDLIRVIRHRWRFATAVFLLTVAAAALLTVFSPRVYQARTSVFVSVLDNKTNSDLVSGSTYAQAQVGSYMDVVTSPLVLQPVIDALDLGETTDSLARRVDVVVPDQTVLIDIAVEDADPERAAAIANTIVDRFSDTVEKLEATSSKGRSRVSITPLRRAITDDDPISPKPGRNLLLGAALGLALGLGAALLREMLDVTIRSESDVAKVTPLPALGSIPLDPTVPKRPLITHQSDSEGKPDGQHVRAEAFRSLRTNLQFVQTGTGRRSVVVTSSRPGEGKTVTAANMGLSMAAMGSRVCLIEGDLRRPKLLDYMGLEGSVGLTTVLIGAADLADVIQPFTEGLSVIGAGRIPPNPSELLGSPRMEALLLELESRFDHVIIDAPPLLPVTDAAVLSQIAGSTVVVVGLGRIEKDDLRRALSLLAKVDASTVGIIANMVPRTSPREGSTYYYYEGYRSDPDLEPEGERERTPIRPVTAVREQAGASAGRRSG